MKFEWSPKRSWEDYGPNKGWNNDAMGKWAIAQLSDGKLYWFYGDGGDPISYGTRHGLWFRYKGYIDTWSRDFHCYEDDSNSFDEVAAKIGSDNIWAFSSGEFDEYGTFIQNNSNMSPSR